MYELHGDFNAFVMNEECKKNVFHSKTNGGGVAQMTTIPDKFV